MNSQNYYQPVRAALLYDANCKHEVTVIALRSQDKVREQIRDLNHALNTAQQEIRRLKDDVKCLQQSRSNGLRDFNDGGY